MSPESSNSAENKDSFFKSVDSVGLANIANETDSYVVLYKFRTIAYERLTLKPDDEASTMLLSIVLSRMKEMQDEEKEVARLLTLEAMSIGYWESQFNKNELPPQ